MQFNADTLDAWLAHLEQLHPNAIDMGLERVARVRDAMQLKPAFPVIIVGGTNGKGSTCTMLSAAYRAAGFKVGTYTSPHLLHYNERVAIDLVPASDARLVAGFRAVEAARGEDSLTYFEFGTLAAMHQFIAEGVDVAVLEVGLGGRLDAVNVFEPDVAAVVSIDIDHQDYLGDTREAIGYEKAGIFRAGKPAFCADPLPPESLLAYAKNSGIDLQCIGRDFSFINEVTQWRWRGRQGQKPGLPFPALRGAYQLGNASLVIAILDALHERLPVSIGDIKRGLVEVELAGRYQVLPGRPSIVLDVAHNPHAASALAHNLSNQGFFQTTHAVFGALADKDIAGVVELLKDRIDVWHVANLDVPRAAPAEKVAGLITTTGAARVHIYPDVFSAFTAARSAAGENDRIAAFGCFKVVADMLALKPR
ncbi:bifunctional tetrahydrofolate synthase/dihydrofolate synthase [Chitinimonas sp. BJB300]|uniref:bifunctional tetrahydrofolate synthase/dihydrofolate synthase n=1 Tax=Chitinimonas sp. BJB300 TaxID=1559339 RepID=UPI000C11F86F|nr:bifunctional tetrahydrofolate synthase/dihydrofolate synthase [Chitinimonas sp. BJB300]PHV13320.1 bifunctional tetrahydrofolate synthase/dihydrofolate synthase [Chitinimonas sp. BJB300]TSJ85975.1 bifunctional tetrahydrofolate synthase/dihydrofolate synthase [Chitinimonas sp. BJB300]